MHTHTYAHMVRTVEAVAPAAAALAVLHLQARPCSHCHAPYYLVAVARGARRTEVAGQRGARV